MVYARASVYALVDAGDDVPVMQVRVHVDESKPGHGLGFCVRFMGVDQKGLLVD